ncbi:polysaccharide deacetylase family protein [Actinoplanes sp. NPDC023714]|uniref:polysaccharide deacetylase family protein n=1 Tax=Actinoplanes sp. NPDC023714 TaxID=3154322 RepID=UPI003401BB58
MDGARVGRHRRPDAPAENDPAGTPTLGNRALILSADSLGTDSGTRSARHRAATGGSSYGARSVTGARGSRGTGSRSARHSQTTPRASRDRARERNSAARHRAPGGTVPLDGWLKAARNRPQLMLGTLVVAGLLLTALPTIPQQGGGPTSVMNVAAQAVSRATSSKPAPEETRIAAPIATTRPESAEQAEKPSPAALTAAPTTPPAAEVQPAKLAVPKGDGPSNSLRTTGSRTVTLTFDDGPDPNETPRILEILAKYDVKAVFCLVGTQAQRYPELVKQISDAGHVLCNHTWDHDLKIGKKKPEQILEDLVRTNEAIRAAVPGAEIPYFRAPGGNFTDRLVRVAYTGGGMTSLYWEVDPRDWEHPAGETAEQHVKRIVSTVKKETRPGSIILSHDFNQPSTTKAYDQLMPWLVKNFSLGIPGQEPAPATTEPTPAPSSPAPVEPTPATPSPSVSGSPAAESPAAEAPAGGEGGAAAAGAGPSVSPSAG